MRIELKGARVELEVGEVCKLEVNGHIIPLPREVGVRLIFGEEVSAPVREAAQTPPDGSRGPGLAKARDKPKERKFGCQTPAAKRKLSKSLLKFHANKRKKERKEEKQLSFPKGNLSKRKILNGVNNHIN